MKVTERDVSYIADLANLDLTGEERTRLVRDLNSILDYIDRLNQLDTSNISPMAQVLNSSSDTTRDDVLHGLRPSLPHDLALANAPDSDGAFFKVPKVIERADN